MSNDTVKNLIKALRERTTARGCTEAEAMEAAAKAARLMAEHGLDDIDLVMAQGTVATRSPTGSSKAMLWPTIATCTNCKALVSELASGRQLTFFGREPGPEIAVYLFDVCETAIKYETTIFRQGDFYRRRRTTKTRRKAVDDFTLGLVQRLSMRLRELFAPTRSETALADAEAYLDRCHPKTHSITQKARKAHFDQAVNAGWAAGGRVNLAHGVGTAAKPKLIGGR